MLLLPVKFEHEILGRWPWLNWTFGVICLTVFLTAWFAELSLKAFTLSRDAAPWAWLSYGFVHANLVHLGGNLLFAWIFGNTIERQFGPIRFALLYSLGLVVSGAAQLAWSPDGMVLGASGALYTLIGFETARHPHRRLRFIWWFVFRWGHFLGPVWLLLPIGAVFGVLAWLEGNHSVATAAHAAGLGAGWLLGKVSKSAKRAALA